MDDRKLEIIQDLMSELQDLMSPGADDFEERLGRAKPDMAVMKISAGSDEPDGDEDSGDLGDMDEDFMSPEEKLKSRLMKLRG